MSKAGKSAPAALLDSALSLIAEKGLDGFTYRALASYRGVTLGELTAQAGKKEQLLKSLMEHSLVLQARVHQSWRQRLGRVAVSCPSEFSAIFMAYMRECQGVRRNEAVFVYEMVTELQRIDGATRFIRSYLSTEGLFWTSLFKQWGLENPGEIAEMVRAYYFGDVGYLLNLGDEADYEIALALNLKVLAQYVFSRQPAPTDLSGDELLAALCSSQEATDDRIVLEGKRLEAGQAAARAVIKRGLSGLTHRAAAEELNVSAAAISHYFQTKAELINAALLAMHAVMRQELGDIVKRGGADAAMNEIPVTSGFLLRAMHSLNLAGLHNPDIRPILMRERLTRGKSTGDWLGRPAARVTAQVASLIRYGVALAQGLDVAATEDSGESAGLRLTNVFRRPPASPVD